MHCVVLEVLARTDRPLSGRQTAELVGALAGHRQVNAVLGQLTEAGLVLREHHAPAYLYRLNHDHVAAEAVVALLDLRGILLARMRNLANAWRPKPIAIKLKTRSQYQTNSMAASDALRSIEWASRLVEAAQEVVSS